MANQAPNVSVQAVQAFETKGFSKPFYKDNVDRIKEKAAALWDEIDQLPVPKDNPGALRLISISKTELENAVMWAVKGISRI